MKKMIFLSSLFASSLGLAASNVYCPDIVVCLNGKCITYPEIDSSFNGGNTSYDDTYYFWRAYYNSGLVFCEFKPRTTYMTSIGYSSNKFIVDKSITNVWEEKNGNGYSSLQCTPNPDGHGNPRFCPFKSIS